MANCNPNIIWSRKPPSLKLSGSTFDADDFRLHLKEALEIGKEYFIEFIFRDTNRLTGQMEQRLAEACEILREDTNQPEERR